MKMAWAVGVLVCSTLVACVTRRGIGGGGGSSSSGNSGSGGGGQGFVASANGAGGATNSAATGFATSAANTVGATSTAVGPGPMAVSSSASGMSSCYDPSTAYLAPGTKTVAKLKRCTVTQISSFVTACLGPSATQATCMSYQTANGTCFSCLLATSKSGNADLATPPLLTFPDANNATQALVNVFACEAAAEGKASCGPSVSQAAFCQQTACYTCSQAEKASCFNEASADACKTIAVSATCNPILQVQNFAPQCSGADFNTQFSNVANYLCGM